jgi:hypothetical protein
MLLDQLRPQRRWPPFARFSCRAAHIGPAPTLSAAPGPGSRAKTTPVLAWMALDDSA